jgi:hypothetical protein
MRYLLRVRAPRVLALLPLAIGLACARSSSVSVEPGSAQPDATPSRAHVARTPASGHDVLVAMHERYGRSWSGALRYLQSNTLFRTDGGEARSEWVRQFDAPGRQRIDYLPLSSRSGVLYEDGRAHVFIEGKRVRSEARLDPRQLLIADIGARSADSTARLLTSLGFALDALHTATWDGRPVFIVGAAAGDTTRAQFWVDAERFLLLRLVYPETGGTRTIVTDTRFSRWTEHDGAPVAEEILQVRDGTPVWREEALRIEVGPTFPAAAFDPERWGEGRPVEFVARTHAEASSRR